MKIKQSNLNINKDKDVIAPLHNSTNYCYNNETNDLLSKEQLLFICNNIEKLDPCDHIEIYKLMRMDNTPYEFFSKTNRGVFFDFSKLQSCLQWKVYNLILMSIDNAARTKLYETYTEEHNKIISMPIDMHTQLSK